MTDVERSLTFGQTVLVYFATIVFLVAPPLFLHKWLGLDLRRGSAISLGAVYLGAAARLPWFLFGSLRYFRILALIQDDRAVRLFLAVGGTGLIVSGLLWH